MSKVKVVIIDDEPKAINVIKVQLERYFTSIEVVASCSDSEEAFDVITKAKPDLLFLDIEMPNKNGFDVLLEFEDRKFEVIFVTAYDQYAIEAFKESAIGYILKPVDSEDFVRTVTMALIRVEQKQPINTDALMNKLGSLNTKKEFFSVPDNGMRDVLSQNDIIYCKAEGSYCEIKTKMKKYVVSKNLKHICSSMPSWNFVKVNRSYVINPNHIIKFNPRESAQIILSDQTAIMVSHRIRNQVFSTLRTDYNIF